MDPDALTSVVGRAGTIRRNRRASAIGSALAVLLVVALVALPRFHDGANGAPEPPATSPLVTPTRPALDLTFTSAVHDYVMAYPDGWTVAASSTTNAPDTFSSPTAQTISVSSEALPDGWSEDRWAADFLLTDGGARARDCFPPRDQWLPVDVGGHPGGLLGGDFGCYLTQAVVFVDHRAFIFSAVPELPTGLFDQGLFEQMLASVRFTAATGP